MSDYDAWGLANRWDLRFNLAREVEGRGPLRPASEHITLLKALCWGWNTADFGAPSVDPTYPFGTREVIQDLERLLPSLPAERRLRVYCELPAALLWLCERADLAEDR